MISWINDRLGTASYYAEDWGQVEDVVVVDMRALTDREGNDPQVLRDGIGQAARELSRGHRVVICCDKGVSRSNAIALGVLLDSGMAYGPALRLALDGRRHVDINLGLLTDVRRLFDTGDAGRRPKQGAPARRALVTGAGGYLGRSVLGALRADLQLFTPDRGQLDLLGAPSRLEMYVHDQEIDTVIHLAHPRMRTSLSAMGDAMVMTKSVLELCRLHRLRLLFLSSLAVFSGHESTEPIVSRPSLTPRPRGLYAETKFFSEQLIGFYRETYGLEAAILRPAMVYGGDMDPSMFISKFFELAERGETVRTHRYRNGLPGFDFLHVDDLADALGRALAMWPSTTVNLGTGVLTSTHALARRIVEKSGSASTVETIDIHDETSRIMVDPAQVREELDWQPRLDLTAGLDLLRRRRAGERCGGLARTGLART